MAWGKSMTISQIQNDHLTMWLQLQPHLPANWKAALSAELIMMPVLKINKKICILPIEVKWATGQANVWQSKTGKPHWYMAAKDLPSWWNTTNAKVQSFIVYNFWLQMIFVCLSHSLGFSGVIIVVYIHLSLLDLPPTLWFLIKIKLYTWLKACLQMLMSCCKIDFIR